MSDVPDRLTVVETIYHQSQGENPTAVESRYDRKLKSVGEQPYQRRLTTTEEWQPLDLGWIERPGLIHIQNNEGRFLKVNPTEEERAEIATRILEVCFYPTAKAVLVDGDNPYCWLIPPGEAMRGFPKTGASLVIRCQKGQAKFTVTVFPE